MTQNQFSENVQMGYDVRYTNDVKHLDNNQPLLDAAAAAVTPTVTSGRPQTVSVPRMRMCL